MKVLFTILLVCISLICFSQRDTKQGVNRIGNRGTSKPLSVEYEGNPDHKGMHEVGTIISVRKGPVRVIGARILINKISLPDTAVFILNIYKVKDGRPTADGLYRPVKVPGKVEKGQLDVDLTGYDINADEDFLLALSWADGRGNISFGAGLGGSRSYHRIDNGEWERVPMMKLGFSATIVKGSD
jgi:hypothetical protein